MLGKIMIFILLVYWGFAQNSCYGIFSPNNDLNNGYFYDITKSGNYLYAVASEYDTAGTQLNTIYKLDNLLNIIQGYNIPYNYEIVSPKITATNDGNVIITGTIYEMSFEPIYKFAFITKFSSTGRILWAKKVEFGNGEFHPITIITLKDGSYIVGGVVIWDTLGLEVPMELIRISAQGQIIWEKEIAMGLRTSIEDATPAQDGNFYITGEFIDTNMFGSIGFVAKLSPTGSVLWIKKISYNSNYPEIRGNAITETYDKNVVVAGMIDTTIQDYCKDALIVMLSPTGQKLWSKFYSSDTSGTRTIEYVTLVKEINKNIVVTVDGVSENKLLTLDMQGNIKNTYKLNNTARAEAMLNNYNEVIIAGSSKTPYLIKYNPSETFCSNCGIPATGYINDINVNIQTLTDYTISNGLPSMKNMTFTVAPIQRIIDNGCDGFVAINKNNLNIKVYPKITSGYITIEDAPRGNLILYNSLGQKIFEKNNPRRQNIYLNLFGLPSGIYLLYFTSNKGIFTTKIIKN